MSMRPARRTVIIAASVAVLGAMAAIAYLATSGRAHRPPAAAASPTIAAEVPASATQIVESVVTARLAALRARDLDAYMALIDEGDTEYYTEQRNWYLLFQDAETADYSVEVRAATFTDEGTIVAGLRQHYLLGPQEEDRTIDYENRFVSTADGWKDADLNFSIQETPHFVIKYPAQAGGEAVEVGEAAELAYSSVTEKLGLEPQTKPTIKMYATREMLRESTDIRIAYLFNGWGEAGESIKMYAYRSGNLPNLLAHELVHKITLEIGGSQPCWFAEGLATSFGNWPFAGGNALEMRTSTLEDLTRPVSWLESQDLTQIEDDRTRRTFYDTAGMIVQFTVDTYGLDKLHAVLTELAEFPELGRGYDYSREPELQRRLYESIEKVMGLDRAAYNEAWLAWIGAQ
jgi:hypothetical protein